MSRASRSCRCGCAGEPHAQFQAVVRAADVLLSVMQAAEAEPRPWRERQRTS